MKKKFTLSKLTLKFDVYLLKVYTSLHKVYIFKNGGFSPGKPPVLNKLSVNCV